MRPSCHRAYYREACGLRQQRESSQERVNEIALNLERLQQPVQEWEAEGRWQQTENVLAAHRIYSEDDFDSQWRQVEESFDSQWDPHPTDLGSAKLSPLRRADPGMSSGRQPCEGDGDTHSRGSEPDTECDEWGHSDPSAQGAASPGAQREAPRPVTDGDQARRSVRQAAPSFGAPVGFACVHGTASCLAAPPTRWLTPQTSPPTASRAPPLSPSARPPLHDEDVARRSDGDPLALLR